MKAVGQFSTRNAEALEYFEDKIYVWLWDARLVHARESQITTSIIRRRLLSQSYGGTIDDWKVMHNQHGQLTAASRVCSRGISISAARTGDTEAFACCSAQSLGIDIETTHHSTERLKYVSDTFCAHERHDLDKAAHTTARIIDLWTLKEAYGKALGVGMDMEPHQCHFILAVCRI